MTAREERDWETVAQELVDDEDEPQVVAYDPDIDGPDCSKQHPCLDGH